MVVPDSRGLSYRRRGQGILLEEPRQYVELVPGGGRKPEPINQRLQIWRVHAR